MPMKQGPKYVWPASALTQADMALLHAARESTRPRIPISALLAQAVRGQYGKAVSLTQQPNTMTLPNAA